MWCRDIYIFSFFNSPYVSKLFGSFDIIHYVVAVVCILSLLLAVYAEESISGSLRLSWLATELLPMPLSPSLIKDVEMTVFRANAFLGYVQNFWVNISQAALQGELFAYIYTGICGYKQKIQFYFRMLYLKHISQSRRQLLYLIEKTALKIPIDKNENEVKSYLDIKRELKKSSVWPFMLEVSNVKDKYILCKGKRAMPMSSYSYLDFIRDERVQEAAIDAARVWSTGNHGPRMLGGNTTILKILEKKVADFFNRDDSLLCATGYLACMSAVCALCKEGDLIVVDSRIHACIRTGLQVCGGSIKYFKHNNFNSCSAILRKERHKYRNAWMLVESVYSMDGNLADLPSAHALCKKYNVKLMIDEAHGLGVVGKTGRGVEEHYNLIGVADVIIGTFSKSIGGIGGYITADKDTVEFLDFHAPGNVFSAPLTAYSAGGALEAFRLIDEEPWRIKKTQENSKYLRKILIKGLEMFPADYDPKFKYEVGGDENTTVIPVIFRNDVDRVLRIAALMLDEGYMVSAVVFPACPLATPRFRITATYAYDKELIDNFIKAFVKCVVQCPSSTKL